MAGVRVHLPCGFRFWVVVSLLSLALLLTAVVAFSVFVSDWTIMSSRYARKKVEVIGRNIVKCYNTASLSLPVWRVYVNDSCVKDVISGPAARGADVLDSVAVLAPYMNPESIATTVQLVAQFSFGNCTPAYVPTFSEPISWLYLTAVTNNDLSVTSVTANCDRAVVPDRMIFLNTTAFEARRNFVLGVWIAMLVLMALFFVAFVFSVVMTITGSCGIFEAAKTGFSLHCCDVADDDADDGAAAVEPSTAASPPGVLGDH